MIWIAKGELKTKSNIDNLYSCVTKPLIVETKKTDHESENITLSMNSQQYKYLLIVLVWQKLNIPGASQAPFLCDIDTNSIVLFEDDSQLLRTNQCK